jgi:hypothetical protein
LIVGEAVKCGAVRSGIGGSDNGRGAAWLSVSAFGASTTVGLATTGLAGD